jgi:hypothetical protein
LRAIELKVMPSVRLAQMNSSTTAKSRSRLPCIGTSNSQRAAARISATWIRPIRM